MDEEEIPYDNPDLRKCIAAVAGVSERAVPSGKELFDLIVSSPVAPLNASFYRSWMVLTPQRG